MQKRKSLHKQQDMFLHNPEKMQWNDFKPKEQNQIIDLLSQLLLSLSSLLVIHGGAQHAIKNKD